MEQGAIRATNAPADLLKTKPHFEILDGLRGIAAIVVVIFHFMEVVYIPTENFTGHGFLAVDFFFCLSGFVIAYAYDGRMDKMGIGTFFRLRLIRLHPLVILGSVLGLLTFLFDPFGAIPDGYGFVKIGLLFITSLLLIPYPVMPERYFNLFSFNAPAWTLFWEYIANIAYGLFLWKASRRILAGLAIVAAIGLGYTAYIAGNVMGGWGKDTFWHALPRLAYSFTAGMLVFRYQWIIRNRLGFLGVTALLLVGLLMPYFQYNWLIELIVVLVYFPFLVALGAGARLHESVRSICVFSGKISYPLYMTHYAVIWSFANYYATYKPDAGQLAVIIAIAVPILLGVAWLAMILYDEPVRRWLRKKEQ
ncbi:acyltransferase [Chitinophaga horti]|uniref:Acyltransferase n=1 Tax=Chitinophaga horti TaxID=2920382 RepID=A0ABY6JB97_9BACT|nr:acyltransferase [Chitinophaga horti]UYQ95454.1 acyltransferase [Chitinophaga horti]